MRLRCALAIYLLFIKASVEVGCGQDPVHRLRPKGLQRPSEVFGEARGTCSTFEDLFPIVFPCLTHAEQWAEREPAVRRLEKVPLAQLRDCYRAIGEEATIARGT